MDGYFINPEGNLGHPVAYTHTQIHIYTYTPHRHTYINHIYIHIGRTYSHRVFPDTGKWSDPIVMCNDFDSVCVQEESDLVLLVWIVQKKKIYIMFLFLRER